MKAVRVHLRKDAEERKNARRHKDFGHCGNSETMFALAKLGYCNDSIITWLLALVNSVSQGKLASM